MFLNLYVYHVFKYVDQGDFVMSYNGTGDSQLFVCDEINQVLATRVLRSLLEATITDCN